MKTYRQIRRRKEWHCIKAIGERLDQRDIDENNINYTPKCVTYYTIPKNVIYIKIINTQDGILSIEDSFGIEYKGCILNEIYLYAKDDFIELERNDKKIMVIKNMLSIWNSGYMTRTYCHDKWYLFDLLEWARMKRWTL